MSWKRRAVPVAAVSAVLTLGIAACGGSKSPGTPSSSRSSSSDSSGSSSLSETGSTLLYPLFNLWAPAYKSLHPNVSITTAGTGSGTGISDAEAGSVDIGASDAYLSPADVSTHPGLENVALAISAQEVDYNLPTLSHTHLKLNGAILAGMYTGKIRKWNDSAIAKLNPGVKLPSTTVIPIHRSDGSGDTFLFTQYLDKTDPAAWGKVGYGTTVAFPNVPGNLGEHGNGGMVTGCSANPGCVAYIGISYQSKALAGKLQYAELQNGDGQYVLPTPAAIKAEAAAFTGTTPANESLSLIDGKASGAYPIINYEYAILNTTSLSGATGNAVKAFLTWAISPTGGNAPAFLNQVNFQPLPASVVSLSKALIAKVG
jgi:phosphate transport system substrate-binding protein